METWSALPVTFSSMLINYNFTDAVSKAYGNNLKDLADGSFGLWSGDIIDAATFITGSQDGVIESSDYSELENAVNSILTGYIQQDITGDGVVESGDYSIMENNVSAITFSMHP